MPQGHLCNYDIPISVVNTITSVLTEIDMNPESDDDECHITYVYCVVSLQCWQFHMRQR